MILKPDLLLTEEAPSRRGFIGGLRNLIVAGAGAAATHRLIMPGEAPEDRARRAWGDFCGAMREMTADGRGWKILGAGELNAFTLGDEYFPASRTTFLSLVSVHYVSETVPGLSKPIPVERHTEITL